jgi:pyocin large subunit-like protein
MRNIRRRFIFGFLFLIFIGVFAHADVNAGGFAPEQLEAHYLKHGYQFGQITQEQYLKGAQALLDAVPGGDVLERIRPNGDVEHFRVSTGEFAVMTKRGRIRTFFKTDYGYWMRE